MKNSTKLTFVAFAIAITAAACDPAKKTTADPADSTKIDSTAVVADSTKKDTTVAAPVDSIKKDSVKK
jgi:Skp family chaperone for outer membrane proteins